MTRNTCHSPRTPHPDSVSGFTTEPSQSANARVKSRGRPNHEAPSSREGRRVCSFLQISEASPPASAVQLHFNPNARCALGAFNRDVSPAFFNFTTWFANLRRPSTRGRKPRAAPSGLPRSQPAAKSRQGPSFSSPGLSSERLYAAISKRPQSLFHFATSQSSRADAGEVFRRRATWSCCVAKNLSSGRNRWVRRDRLSVIAPSHGAPGDRAPAHFSAPRRRGQNRPTLRCSRGLNQGKP